MSAIYEIKFLPSGRVKPFTKKESNHYEFEDGSRVDMRTTLVWCNGCGEVSDGEVIETLDEIDQNLAELHDPASTRYRFTQKLRPPDGDLLLHLMIESAVKRRRWREQRQSSPKCIVCGSTEIIVLPINDIVCGASKTIALPINDQVLHPGSQGTIEIRVIGICDNQYEEWFFTPEGDRIPKDT